MKKQSLLFALLGLVLGGAYVSYAYAETLTADAATPSLTTYPAHGGGVGNVKSFSLAVPSTLTSGDVFQLVGVPKGATVLDVSVTLPDLDSSTGLTLDLGYGADTNYFVAASTTGRTGGVIRPTSIDAKPLTLSATDTIDIVVNAAPTTGVGGTITGYVLYQTP
jgi:hypothetical protein